MGIFFFRQIKACFFIEWVTYAIVEATMYREEGENFISWSLPLWTVLMIPSFLAWSHSSWGLRASLVLDLAGPSLVHQKLWEPGLPSAVDMFHENPFVFEHVTLHLQVQAVIHVEVNLLRCTVSPEQLARTLILLIQVTFSIEPGNGQPQASRWSAHLWSARICWRELALAISLVIGSNQTFFCLSKGPWRQALSEAWVYSWPLPQRRKTIGNFLGAKIFNSRVAIHKLM